MWGLAAKTSGSALSQLNADARDVF